MKGKKEFLRRWFQDYHAIMMQAQVAAQRMEIKERINIAFVENVLRGVKEVVQRTHEPISAFSSGFQFVQKLKLKGFKRLGSGCYGQVLAHPSSNKVVKVLTNPLEDGWVPYVKWAAEKGYAGTFAPKVYSYKLIQKDKGAPFGVAVMERLDQTLSEAEGDVLYVHSLAERYARADFENQEFGKLLLDVAQPGAGQFLEDFKIQFKDKGRFDLHSENWMTRGTQLVLTDPLSGWKADNENVKQRFRAAA